MSGSRGYCGIGIVGGKNSANVGTLWRSAANMGAALIFTVGRRFPQQASDTIKAWRHVPYFEVDAIDELPIPKGCVLVGVEQTENAEPLPTFVHPERAIYILGAEDNGLPRRVLERCHRVIEIPSSRCLNVAVAGSIVLYDRNAKA
jgi:tRNA G18 (ribose-2'-O)-methylase SpoU